MTDKKQTGENASDLRRLAEETLKSRMSGDDTRYTDAEAQKLLHELQVHQIELEMQQEELIRAQTELNASRERYFDLYDLAPVGYCTLDEQGRILEANLTAATLLGVERSGLVRMPITRFILSEDQDTYHRHRAAMHEAGKPQIRDIRMQKKDGGVFWAHLMFVAGKTPEGLPIWRIALSDITDHKLAEKKLQESEERFRVLYHNSPDMYVLISQGDAVIQLCNKTLLNKTGYSEEEIIGFPVFKLYHDDCMDEVKQAFGQYVLTGVMRDKEFKLRRKDGCAIDVSLNVNAVKDEAGNILYSISSWRDISDRKQVEKEKSELEAQLHQSQKMESIGRLAGGIAHDFNNLLTGILGFSDIVQDSLPEGNPLKAHVSQIQGAAESAAVLTKQLLAFSRKQIVAPKILNLNSSIRQSESMLRRIIGEDIDFVFLPGQDIGSVLLDPGQIDQVLVNLGVNAKDAMPRGGKLTIETSRVSLVENPCQSCGALATGDFVLLAVSDNGSGMDAETAKNIFEPFFTTKDKGKGTGLGLSTIHGIVHQHNGHLNVYSEPGHGTTFRIYLPLVQTEPAHNAPEEKNGTHSTQGHETIMVVEDLDIIRNLAARTLETLGYTIIKAGNGEAACALFMKPGVHIDLLLTDVIMPQMGGKQLYDTVRKINPALKVLFMSGYTGEAIFQHGVLDEGINFIQKPFRTKELARKVREVLDA